MARARALLRLLVLVRSTRPVLLYDLYRPCTAVPQAWPEALATVLLDATDDIEPHAVNSSVAKHTIRMLKRFIINQFLRFSINYIFCKDTKKIQNSIKIFSNRVAITLPPFCHLPSSYPRNTLSYPSSIAIEEIWERVLRG